MGDDVILRGGMTAGALHQVMIGWMGLETFAVEWAERRDEILLLVEALNIKLREFHRMLAEAPITHANLGGNEVTEVMGPVRYEEFCLPLYDECAEIFHRKGKLLGPHMDGNNKGWSDLLARSGFDYIEAFTPAPDTDMTLSEALSAWPDKVLWINFPSSVHLSGVKEIKQITRELLEAAAGTNRLIIGITEDMPPDRWRDNPVAIADAIDEAA